MKDNFIAKIAGGKFRFVDGLMALLPGLLMLALATGCQTTYPFPAQNPPPGTNAPEVIALQNLSEFQRLERGEPATNAPEVITLREGDVVKISFPANPSLNTTQPIRRDGMISMPLVGELNAAGKTPMQLQKDLVDAYSTQLLSKEVNVEVQSSTFPVYVSGAVLRPGKIVTDHALTALEAVMEAGGPDYTKADLKRVVVVRQQADHSQKYTLNLKLVMEGKGGEPFYLKPGDTIYVPEKFTWF